MKKRAVILFLSFFIVSQLAAMEVCPQESEEKVLFVSDSAIQLHLDTLLKSGLCENQSGKDYEQAVRISSFLESYEILDFRWLPTTSWFSSKEAGGHYIHVKKKPSSPSFDVLEYAVEAKRKKCITWLNVIDPSAYMGFIQQEDLRRKRHNEKFMHFSAGVGFAFATLTGWYLICGE